MLDSRYPRANLFKCGFHLLVVEILWLNVNETPVGPFESPLERRRTRSQNFRSHDEFFEQSGELHFVHESRFPEWGQTGQCYHYYDSVSSKRALKDGEDP